MKKYIIGLFIIAAMLLTGCDSTTKKGNQSSKENKEQIKNDDHEGHDHSKDKDNKHDNHEGHDHSKHDDQKHDNHEGHDHSKDEKHKH